MENKQALIETRASKLAWLVYQLLQDKKYQGNWLVATDIARHLKVNQGSVEQALIDLALLRLIKLNCREVVR
jgi:Mn-dependent DtxR family transcriptional regulator